jgi:hypothetical protein
MSSDFKSRSFAICGCPRSGTTWLHNTLIKHHRFNGEPADDRALIKEQSRFATHENRYVHKALLKVELSGGALARGFINRQKLKALDLALRHRLAANGQMMLKSPYFCYFLGSMHRAGLAQKIVFMKRNLASIATSMITHPHISDLISGDYNHFFDFGASSQYIEVKHIPQQLRQFVSRNFDKMTPFDRALYKCLCFTTSFAAHAKDIPPENIAIFEFDQFSDDANHRATIYNFLELDKTQRHHVDASYAPPRPIPEELPPHSPMMRDEIMAINTQLMRELRPIHHLKLEPITGYMRTAMAS